MQGAGLTPSKRSEVEHRPPPPASWTVPPLCRVPCDMLEVSGEAVKLKTGSADYERSHVGVEGLARHQIRRRRVVSVESPPLASMRPKSSPSFMETQSVVDGREEEKR